MRGRVTALPRLKLIVSRRATGCTHARVARVRAELSASHQVVVYELRGHGDYRNALAPEDDLVAVAGGDGTIREIASLLFNTDKRLAVIPVGTANVIAIGLGIRGDADAVARIRAGRTVPWRVFRANGEPFLFCAGAGVDGETCRLIDKRLKAQVRKLSYVASLLRVLRTYQFPRFTVDVLPGRQCTQAVLLACGYYAGRTQLVESDYTDELLELLTLAPGRFGVLPALLAMTLRGPRHNRCVPVSACTLIPEDDRKVPYQIDGDFAGYLPLTIAPAGIVNIIR